MEKTVRGILFNSGDISQIKASMLAILLTKQGERVMEPTFGTPLDTLNINEPRELIQEKARQMIALALKKWENRVQVEDVQANCIDSDLGIDLNIKVFFIDPVNLQETHQLSIQTPIGR